MASERERELKIKRGSEWFETGKAVLYLIRHVKW
jgi:hypothetical protein